jgi:hypothetical protein
VPRYKDRSHTPHRLQTTLTPAQEAVAVALRKTLLVSLDDLLSVVREFLNPNASRSGLDRCLRRHGVGNLRDMKAKAPKPKHSAFNGYSTACGHLFHAHVASHSMTCGHPREVICEAVSS